VWFIGTVISLTLVNFEIRNVVNFDILIVFGDCPGKPYGREMAASNEAARAAIM